jgi:hypothetical protein
MCYITKEEILKAYNKWVAPPGNKVDDNAYKQLVIRKRWGHKIRCTRCNSDRVRLVLWNCAQCRDCLKGFSVYEDTIFYKKRIDLSLFFTWVLLYMDNEYIINKEIWEPFYFVKKSVTVVLWMRTIRKHCRDGKLYIMKEEELE